MNRDLEAAEALVLLAEHAVLSCSPPAPVAITVSQLLEDMSHRFMIYHDGKNLIMKLVSRSRKRPQTGDDKINRKVENECLESSLKNVLTESNEMKEEETDSRHRTMNTQVKNSEEEELIDVVGLDSLQETVLPQSVESIWNYSPPAKKGRKTSDIWKHDTLGKRKKSCN